MKKTTMMRIAATLLIAVLLTTCAIGATFAKYTATQSNSDSARVAKWAFEFNDADIAKTAINFDLFNTTNYTETAVDKDGSGSEVVIAPGTTGSFAITLENTSEVAAAYSITFTTTNDTVPIEYSLDNTTWKANIAELNPTGELQYETTAPTITVYWRWVYEVANDPETTEIDETAIADATDKALGIAATLATVEVTANITATQLDVYS